MGSGFRQLALAAPPLLLAAAFAGCSMGAPGASGCGMPAPVTAALKDQAGGKGGGGAGAGAPQEPSGPTGYSQGAYAGALIGFGDDGKPTPARSARDSFASLAQSLPPTKGNMAFIAQQLGPGAGHLDPQGNYIFNGDDGGYIAVGKSGASAATWQWQANDAAHPSPHNEVKLATPPGMPNPDGTTGGAEGASAGTGAASSSGPHAGCWPKPPPIRTIGLKIHGGNGNRVVVDSTPQTCSNRQEGYCQTVMGDQNRSCCPMRPEGDPMRGICEYEVMGSGPKWDYWGTGHLVPMDNPYLMGATGIGTVRACSRVSGVCNAIQVPGGTAGAKAPPAAP
ncbi:MAG: hypothetical protein ACHQ51_15055, partial [Elusimicrobiota bacterium]